MKIICDNCGNANNKGATYCSFCYKKLDKKKSKKKTENKSVSSKQYNDSPSSGFASSENNEISAAGGSLADRIAASNKKIIEETLVEKSDNHFDLSGSGFESSSGFESGFESGFAVADDSLYDNKHEESNDNNSNIKEEEPDTSIHTTDDSIKHDSSVPVPDVPSVSSDKLPDNNPDNHRTDERNDLKTDNQNSYFDANETLHLSHNDTLDSVKEVSQNNSQQEDSSTPSASANTDDNTQTKEPIPKITPKKISIKKIDVKGTKQTNTVGSEKKDNAKKETERKNGTTEKDRSFLDKTSIHKTDNVSKDENNPNNQLDTAHQPETEETHNLPESDLTDNKESEIHDNNSEQNSNISDFEKNNDFSDTITTSNEDGNMPDQSNDDDASQPDNSIEQNTNKYQPVSFFDEDPGTDRDLLETLQIKEKKEQDASSINPENISGSVTGEPDIKTEHTVSVNKSVNEDFNLSNERLGVATKKPFLQTNKNIAYVDLTKARAQKTTQAVDTKKGTAKYSDAIVYDFVTSKEGIIVTNNPTTNNAFKAPDGTVFEKTTETKKNYLKEVAYDGYYDDVLPYDFDNEETMKFDKFDPEMIKKIAMIVGIAAAAFIIAAIMFIYF